jgi:lysosomal Pro-X carboxypeptidase
LSIENAMMDYIQAINDVKQKYTCEDSPVITFGGSYGAMLAAWMRMKFP